MQTWAASHHFTIGKKKNSSSVNLLSPFMKVAFQLILLYPVNPCLGCRFVPHKVHGAEWQCGGSDVHSIYFSIEGKFSFKKCGFVLSVGNGRRQDYFLTSCEFHCCVPVSGNFTSLGLNFLLAP